MADNRGNRGYRRGGRGFHGTGRGRGQESGGQSFQRSDTGTGRGRGNDRFGQESGGQSQWRGSSDRGRNYGETRNEPPAFVEGRVRDDRSFHQESGGRGRGSSDSYRGRGRGRPQNRGYGGGYQGRPDSSRESQEPSATYTTQSTQSSWSQPWTSAQESVTPRTQSAWAQPSTSGIVEQLAAATLRPSSEGPSEQLPSPTKRQELDSETTSSQNQSKNKKSKKKKGKNDQGEQPSSAAIETPGPSSSKSQEQISPSIKTSEGKQISGSVDERPAFAITTIPLRRKEGPIHVGSKYFDQQKVNWKIEVNYLPIEFSNKNLKIYHYDVEFPEKTNKSDFRALVREMRRRHFPNRHPAFDGAKNLYAAQDRLFPGNSVSSTVTITRENGKVQDYNVTIQLAHHDDDLTISSLYNYIKNGCSMNVPSATIQAIDVAIRGNLFDRFATCGRAFYTMTDRRLELSAGLELFHGFTQSAIIGQKPYLNVDVSHRGFYTKQSLIEYLEKLITSMAGYNREPEFGQFENGLRTFTRDRLEEYLKQNNGLRVIYKDPRTQAIRRHRIKGLAQKPKETFFEITENERVRSINVFEYYRSGKGYPIKYPNLPVLETARGEYLPIECCDIDSKQPVQNRYQYTGDETRNMIKNCTDVPFDRKQKILRNIQDAKFNEDPIQREFGITIGERGNTRGFLQVPAGSLLAPNVIYRNGPVQVNNGTWEMKEFYNGTRVTNWIILNMNDRTTQSELGKLANELKNNGRLVGVAMDNPSATLSLKFSGENDITRMFEDLKRKSNNLELVVVVLPSNNTDIVYRRVKYVSEIKVGLLTQCVQPRTVQRMTWMTAKNILLKINSKVTGINHIMYYPGNNPTTPLMDGSTMFLGADVTHPPPGPKQKEEPSICAVAGSYDHHGSKYKMLYSVQSSKQEMIDGMERMVYELLNYFKDQNAGKLPKKIYYYRDGVSEGQFSQVLDIELRAIKAAFNRLNTNIAIAVIVVQKRHHTRFFPPREIGDRKGNVLAGTVVSTEITHPREHNFFLVSHQSIQGTARPTKYHVLYDEIRAPEDEVEALTYYLCYMFVRCTRSVSYPAPTYYSHLAAERAGRYVKCAREAKLDLTQGPIGNGKIHPDMVNKNPMYFV